MNIVFVYHNGDAELALESAKAITAMGSNYNHVATVCCTEDTKFVFEITEELKKTFPSVNRIVARDGFNGWPLGPNQMFVDASNYCYSRKTPWYFWEPDCVPMVERWADKLEEEFNKHPDKIMGCLIEGGMAPSGKNVYKLIVGSAVYPARFLDRCGLAANLYNYNSAYQNSQTVPEPWDVRCRWVFMQNGRNTDFIKAYWKSCNYQYKGEDIVFFAEDPEAQEIQSVTCPDGRVDPQAVVVHGCKDGSLHRMAIAGFPMPKPVMPSDSTGLNIPSNSMGLENISDQEQKVVQGADTCLPSPAVCNKTSKKKSATVKKPRLIKLPVSQDQKDFIKQLNKLAKNVKAIKNEQTKAKAV